MDEQAETGQHPAARGGRNPYNTNYPRRGPTIDYPDCGIIDMSTGSSTVPTYGGLLDVAPVRGELTYMLVRLDKKYTMESPDEKFEDYYAGCCSRDTPGQA